jgi:hypothetical protein
MVRTRLWHTFCNKEFARGRSLDRRAPKEGPKVLHLTPQALFHSSSKQTSAQKVI